MDDVRYAEERDGHIAYRFASESGARDLIVVSGMFFPMSLLDEDRIARRFIEGLGALGRLVVFDKRGIGLSDPISDWSRAPRLQWADDLAAVITAAELEDVAVVSWEPFGTARHFAATRPNLLGRLVLVNAVPSMRRMIAAMVAGAGDNESPTSAVERSAFPSRIDDPAFQAWLERAGRSGASPTVATRTWTELLSHDDDLTPPGIRCPTLVLHNADCMASRNDVRSVAGRIATAEFVEVEGRDVFPIAGDVDALVAETARFLTGSAMTRSPDRTTAAVLFTDLVSSTDRASTAGDDQWRSVLDIHDRVVRSAVERVGGTVIKFTGDGVLATLPSAHGALAAAKSIRTQLAETGLEIRAGIHVGDIEQRDLDVSGITVNAAARIMDRAEDGEIAVSESVRLAVLGTTDTFDNPREVALKGLPEQWTIHRAI